MRSLACCLLAVVGLVLLSFAQPVVAAENGSSFYLLGQRGQGAGILPPVEGIFFSLPNYYYSGDASASRGLPVGGAVTFGLDADVFLTLPTLIWVTPVDLLGGDLAFSGTFVYGNSDVSARLALEIPGIINRAIPLNDERWVVGDPVFGALLGWHGENYHYNFAPSVNIPAGSYDAGRLANIALNRWVGDITGAGTWLFAGKSIELSGALGFTFNGENDDTKYETGTEFHLEASIFYHFSETFSVGLNGYHYDQLTGDSGAGATLGDFKGRVTALGPGISGTFQVGPAPVSMSFRYFNEFNVKNRLEGDACWLTVSLPLWVPGQ